MRLERAEDGVYLTAQLRFELSATVEDALLKGIPMVFVAEAELLRDRWYWYDKRITMATRFMRLAYQPLTRRWRLNVSPYAPGGSGLGVTLGQGYDSLADALAAIQRVSRWKIAEATEVDPDARHNVDFRFRLDMTQLPRPFQIGAAGQPEWTIALARNQRLSMELAK